MVAPARHVRALSTTGATARTTACPGCARCRQPSESSAPGHVSRRRPARPRATSPWSAATWASAFRWRRTTARPDACRGYPLSRYSPGNAGDCAVRVFVTSDSDVRTGVGEVNDQIGEEIARFFKPRSYGEAIQAVVVC